MIVCGGGCLVVWLSVCVGDFMRVCVCVWVGMVPTLSQVGAGIVGGDGTYSGTSLPDSQRVVPNCGTSVPRRV